MSHVKIQEETAAKVAAMLLQIQAIKLNLEKPFRWSSGWNSPIYCDNRLSLSFPEIRSEIRKALADAITKNFPTVQSIAGVATAGIAQGALVADALQLPFCYVRPKPKDHGMENLIEGRVEKDQRVVVVEDLVSTGGSSLKAVQALRDQSVEVLGMVSIFNYGFATADENFAAAGVKLVSLSDYDHLITYARTMNYVTDQQVESLRAWRLDPANWKGRG